MGLLPTMALATLAGLTVFLTLPLARVRGLSERGRLFCTMIAVGVLLFVLVEVVAGAVEPIEEAMGGAESEEAVLLGVLFVVALAAGMLGIPAFESRLRRRLGPGAGTAASVEALPAESVRTEG